MRVKAPRTGFNLAPEQLCLDDFIGRGNANRFGDRQGQHRVATGGMQLDQDVPQQVLGGNRAVLFELAAEREGITVNHRPDLLTLVNFMQRQHPASAFDRIPGEAADAVRQARADQFFDDVALQHGPASDTRAAFEQRTESVFKIRVQHDTLLPKFCQ